MTAPVIRQFLGTIPDKGQAQTAFDTNVDAFLDWQALQFAPDLVAFGTFASDTAAALVAANLPSLTGRALDAVRVNAAADGVEFADVTAAGWELLDDADAAAQRTTLGLGSAALMVDSADADLAVDPDGAARRDIVASAIAAVAGAAIGVGQTWQNVEGSRVANTSYQNTTGRPIMVLIRYGDGNDAQFQVSSNNSTWLGVQNGNNNADGNMSAIIPDGYYYRITAGISGLIWVELR